MVQSDCLANLDHALVVKVFPAVCDIFSEAALKKPCVLKHHAEQRMYLAALHGRDRNAVYAYLPAPQLVKVHEQVDYRCFSRTGMPDYCYRLPRLHRRGKVSDHGLVGYVSEAHMVKLHPAEYPLRGISQLCVAAHLGLREEAEHTLARCRCRLEPCCGGGYLRKRRRKQSDICDKRHDGAEIYAAVQRKRSTDDTDGDVAEVADKAHKRSHKPGEKLRFPCGFVQVVVYPVKFPPGFLLSAVYT